MNPRYTLKKNSDFRRLYAKGKNAVTPFLVLYCRPNRLGEKRVGFTVSAKLGHAVVRNRVRRQLREIYRLHEAELSSGTDYIIVARSRCLTGDYHRMEDAFLSACEKLNLLKKEP